MTFELLHRLRALVATAACTAGVLVIAAATLAAQDRPADRKAGDDVPAAKAEPQPATEGPATDVKPHPHRTGDAMSGKDVFRFETFGNEGFWTDGMRMPAGMEEKKITPLDALKTGLLVDSEAVPPEMMRAMAKELKTDLSPKNAPMLNDPMTTVKLIEANAVVGMVPKDTNGDGTTSLAAGDKVGVSCAICHTITADPVFAIPGAGSIGRRVDGPAALVLNVGKLLATAANSRAYYPNLQLELGGKTIGRAPKGLTEDSTEAEVDAYLSNPKFYPIGTFDETQDGIGNPVVNQPLFRQDLAAPYATAGEFAVLDDISNASYTMNLDPTSLVTPDGRAFLKTRAGPLGEELAGDYAKILKETGVKGHPFVKASVGHKVGAEQHPVGRRVDDQKLIDMNAYLDSLPDPDGASVNAESFARGRELFMANRCTACHNVDQGKPVPAMLVDLDTLFPAYKPQILAKRMPPLTPVQNSPGGFDDKMVVIDASGRGDIRGNAVPMLLDLARKEMFLHDASVDGLEMLLNPKRGEEAPHPFYLADEAKRADLIAFLEGSDTRRGATGVKERSAQDAPGPRVGDAAPPVELQDLKDRAVSLKALREKQPVVVMFLRGFPGYQCPLCTRQVGSFLAAAGKLKDAGVRVLLIYPGPAKELKERADEFARGEGMPEHFDLVIDPDYVATDAWGLRWDADNETAYPSTFIVSESGVIRFAKVSTDHGGRSSPDDVLSALAE